MSGRHQPVEGADSPAGLAGVQVESERFIAAPQYSGWGVEDTDGEEPTQHIGDEARARYVAMLRNAGIDRLDAEMMSDDAECSRCGAAVYSGTLDTSDRCAECQS